MQGRFWGYLSRSSDVESFEGLNIFQQYMYMYYVYIYVCIYHIILYRYDIMFCTFTSPAFDLQETYVLFLQPAVALGCIDLQEIPISWLNNIPMKMEAAK